MAIPPKATWRAVKVVPGASACAAAQRASGKRFLTRDAPRLPLKDCDHQDTCQCTYQHRPDRRGELRRTKDSGYGITPKVVSAERRRPGERRDRKR
jgi:hypothetical protein